MVIRIVMGAHHPARVMMVGIMMIVGESEGSCGQRRSKYTDDKSLHVRFAFCASSSQGRRSAVKHSQLTQGNKPIAE
jgi:hypothetical protein